MTAESDPGYIPFATRVVAMSAGKSYLETLEAAYAGLQMRFDAERAKVKALREALEYARRFLKPADVDMAFIDAALAATSDPEPEAPSDVHPQECGR